MTVLSSSFSLICDICVALGGIGTLGIFIFKNMRKRIILIILYLLLAVQFLPAQTHNVTRRSGASSSMPRTSTKQSPSKSSRRTKSTSSKKETGTRNLSQSERNRIINNLISNMVYVEGGTFTMGATPEQCTDKYDDDAKPTHQVILSSFYIGRYEVTQEEWVAVMGKNPSEYKGNKRPVENVDWDDCQEFIRKLNTLTGKNFRLPTEAEWEFAARGGNNSRGYKYSGGNDINSVAWYTNNSDWETHKVGLKQSNELGLYDMSGNVRELCSDWLGNYSSNSQTNPKGALSGYTRVNRGCGFSNLAWHCLVSTRCSYPPVYNSGDLGLRLAF